MAVGTLRIGGLQLLKRARSIFRRFVCSGATGNGKEGGRRKRRSKGGFSSAALGWSRQRAVGKGGGGRALAQWTCILYNIRRLLSLHAPTYMDDSVKIIASSPSLDGTCFRNPSATVCRTYIDRVRRESHATITLIPSIFVPRAVCVC